MEGVDQLVKYQQVKLSLPLGECHQVCSHPVLIVLLSLINALGVRTGNRRELLEYFARIQLGKVLYLVSRLVIEQGNERVR